MPVRFIVIEIEWIKSAASRCSRAPWRLPIYLLLFLILKKNTSLVRPMLFSIYPPWHLLLHSTTCSFHTSCLILPRFSEVLFFSLWSLFFCQILFEWSLSFPVSISCSLLNDTFGNIQKAYLERKRSVGRKTSSLTLGFSHILKYDILLILKIF